MKKILFLLFVCYLSVSIYGQQNVGIGTTNPRPRAILDLTATDKGFLPPRTDPMSILGLTAQDAGLLIYNPADNYYYYWTGTQWLTLPDQDWQIIGGGAAQYSIPPVVGIGTTTPNATFHVNGTIRFESLLNSLDTTVLVTDALGYVTRRPLPNSAWDGDNQSLALLGNTLTISGGNSVNLPFTNIVPGLGLISSGPAGNQTIDVQANNGLNVDAVADAVQLGGPLIENTAITNGNFNLDVNLNGTGHFEVQNNGAPLIHADNVNNGRIGMGTGIVSSNNAFVEMVAQSRGILIPEVTDIQMNAIPVAAPQDLGLMVYNTDENVHMYWNGTCWLPVGVTICTDFSIDCGVGAGCIYTSSASIINFDMPVVLNSGSAVPVILAVAGVPNGVTVSFSSTSVVPTDTVNVSIAGSTNAAPGVYTLNFLALFGPIVQQCNYTLTIVPGSLTISSNAGVVNEISVAPNTTVASTQIDINFSAGACSACNQGLLSVSNVPAGVTASISTNPIPTSGGSSVITFTANSCANVGVYNILITLDLCGQLITFPYTLEVDTSVINVAANANNLNLFNMAATPACPITLICNIAPGITVSSNTTAAPAFTTGLFPAGSIIDINVGCDAFIVGKGGDGGRSDNDWTVPNCANINGLPGGPALSITTTGVTVNTSGSCNGLVGGGGGGGGAGSDVVHASLCMLPDFDSGGGGGGGAGGGLGGVTPGGDGCTSNSGTNGSFPPVAIPYGLGGGPCVGNCSFSIPFIGTFSFNYAGGVGGNGGSWGQPGSSGTGYNCGGSGTCSILGGTTGCDIGSGGGPGSAIISNGNTFIYVGQNVGPITCTGACTLTDPGLAGAVQ